ncbi:UvrD-helicase domain-containing protein [uncultured Roseibium sp.]|uniref:UvrD-helicase domain-containing protein n=1 Tax=uncultured Roseibium sp. TaxID=1936171 RepID=UPI002639FD7D|nr:UvrD-helicase domain-containing protein [uncultured Roseibium sp.]
MKYVCLDDDAVAELISGREYQSIDFEEGDKLIQALVGKVQFLAKLGKVILYQDQEGAFLTTKGNWKQKRYLVIDCEQSSLFTQLRSGETLTSFQKLLRFCSKYWSGATYNKSEKLISGTSKAVIFPLPYTERAPFRIAIEREPLKQRLKKREMDGRFLLVYKSGYEAADSATEQPEETVFRRVFERLPGVYKDVSEAAEEIASAENKGQMISTELATTPTTVLPAHMPLNDWLPLLTKQQRKFIFAEATTPHRLQGPAGTGKTLSLMLRAIRVLRQAESKNQDFRALIVTHSEATREAIESSLTVIDIEGYQYRDKKKSEVSLSVETLASLCAGFLSQSISEAEFIDRDANDSKILQRLYIEQAIAEALDEDMPSFSPYLSEEFISQIKSFTSSELSVLFQHEISVLIKGRAGDSFDVYRKCPSIKYGLQVFNDADKGFVFSIFKRYQRQLETSSQFDTDDVVISAIGQLDTPIWRRRRSREGYDFIAVDETHLFNMNELHVFHHFTREVGKFPISFTVDQAQAVGDRGWDDISSLSDLFGSEVDVSQELTSFTAVFRSSPRITDFSQAVLASGATLFTNFNNTLLGSHSIFTPEEERRSKPVKYIEFPDDAAMIAGALKRADELQSETKTNRSKVLITSHSEEIISEIYELAKSSNKPVTILERRGDFVRLKQAEQSGHLVLGHVDFVGGLEFDVVVIVGVDKGRVPSEGESETSNSRSFAAYSAHNRLYVASSRARFALNLLGVKSRGPSDLLRGAALGGLIEGVPTF